jgi:hypothetical protein
MVGRPMKPQPQLQLQPVVAVRVVMNSVISDASCFVVEMACIYLINGVILGEGIDMMALH